MAPSAKTPKLQEGRPARHLVSTYYKSEEQTRLGKGSGCFKTPLPPWAGLATSPFSLWNGGGRGAGQRLTPALRGACANLRKSGSREETSATLGDAAAPAQPLRSPYLSAGEQPLRTGRRNSSDLYIPQLCSHQNPAVPTGAPSTPPESIISVAVLPLQHQALLTAEDLISLCLCTCSLPRMLLPPLSL